jgi:hypothetical protein
VIFEGVRGSGVYGDIAVDDISMTSAACGGQLLKGLRILMCDLNNFINKDVLNLKCMTSHAC